MEKPWYLAPALACGALLLAACGGADETPSRAAPSLGALEPVAATEPARHVVAALPAIADVGAAPAPGTFVATVGGDVDANLAIVVRGDEVVVYLCDGRAQAEWFGATASDGRFAVRSERGTVVRGALDRPGVAGTVTLDGGRAVAFEAAPAHRGATGLFVQRDFPDVGYVARWIVTDASLRGLSTDDETGATKGAVRTEESTSGGAATVGGTSGGGGTTTTRPATTVPRGATTIAASRGGGCVDAVPGGCRMTCAQVLDGLSGASKLMGSGMLTKEGLATTARLHAAFMSQLGQNGCG